MEEIKMDGGSGGCVGGDERKGKKRKEKEMVWGWEWLGCLLDCYLWLCVIYIFFFLLKRIQYVVLLQQSIFLGIEKIHKNMKTFQPLTEHHRAIH